MDIDMDTDIDTDMDMNSDMDPDMDCRTGGGGGGGGRPPTQLSLPPSSLSFSLSTHLSGFQGWARDNFLKS